MTSLVCSIPRFLISFGLMSITALGAAGASDSAGTNQPSNANTLRAAIEGCAGKVKPVPVGEVPDPETTQLNQISLASVCYHNLALRTGMVAVLTPIKYQDGNELKATVGICFFMKGEVSLPVPPDAKPQFSTDRSVDPSFVTCWDDSLSEFRPAFRAAQEVFKAHGLSEKFEALVLLSKNERAKILAGQIAVTAFVVVPRGQRAPPPALASL